VEATSPVEHHVLGGAQELRRWCGRVGADGADWWYVVRRVGVWDFVVRDLCALQTVRSFVPNGLSGPRQGTGLIVHLAVRQDEATTREERSLEGVGRWVVVGSPVDDVVPLHYHRVSAEGLVEHASVAACSRVDVRPVDTDDTVDRTSGLAWERFGVAELEVICAEGDVAVGADVNGVLVASIPRHSERQGDLEEAIVWVLAPVSDLGASAGNVGECAAIIEYVTRLVSGASAGITRVDRRRRAWRRCGCRSTAAASKAERDASVVPVVAGCRASLCTHRDSARRSSGDGDLCNDSGANRTVIRHHPEYGTIARR